MIYVNNLDNKDVKILILLCFLSISSFCATEAIVKADKAVIYSDKTLSTPIGFIKKNKKILIGEKLLRRGQIARSVASGKIVYVQVKDLKIDDRIPKKDFKGFNEGKLFFE